jgi:hypothetical protein
MALSGTSYQRTRRSAETSASWLLPAFVRLAPGRGRRGSISTHSRRNRPCPASYDQDPRWYLRPVRALPQCHTFWREGWSMAHSGSGSGLWEECSTAGSARWLLPEFVRSASGRSTGEPASTEAGDAAGDGRGGAAAGRADLRPQLARDPGSADQHRRRVDGEALDRETYLGDLAQQYLGVDVGAWTQRVSGSCAAVGSRRRTRRRPLESESRMT